MISECNTNNELNIESNNMTTTDVKISIANLDPLLTLFYNMRGGENLSNEPRTEPDVDRLVVLGLVLQIPLNVVELRQSKIHGRGVFTRRKVAKDEVLTLYPADLITYRPDGFNDDPPKIGTSYGAYGAGITEPARNNYLKNNQYYGDYGNQIIPFYRITGTPENDANPAYLGHFINDSARCTKDERSIDIYTVVTKAKQNCMFVSISGLHIAVVATRDIAADEELYVPYAVAYWTNRS